MQLCSRKISKGRSDQIHLCKQFSDLLQIGTLSEHPWNQLVLRHIFSSFFHFLIHCVADKIQSRHADALFIDRIIVQRISIRHMCHTDHPIMRIAFSHMAKIQRKFTRCYHNLVSIRKLIIQRPAEIKVFCLIRCCCTHNFLILSLSQIRPHRSLRPEKSFSYRKARAPFPSRAASLRCSPAVCPE